MSKLKPNEVISCLSVQAIDTWYLSPCSADPTITVLVL